MSFQTTRDRESICFEDASLVYVRDRHGELRSPPGYEKSRVVSKLRVCDTVYGNINIHYYYFSESACTSAAMAT